MAEEVSTGGLVRFRYEKDSKSKLTDERRKEIREAYAQADERKQRERRNRIIFWIIGLVVGLVALVLLLRFLL